MFDGEFLLEYFGTKKRSFSYSFNSSKLLSNKFEKKADFFFFFFNVLYCNSPYMNTWINLRNV